MTPLIYAIRRRTPAVALWLIEHRGQHDVNTTAGRGSTALHIARRCGLLPVVQALVPAGANASLADGSGRTPLMEAIVIMDSDVEAFLLQLPAVKATIDAIDNYEYAALSRAASNMDTSTVQLLLDAGADINIPAGVNSPLDLATYHEGTAKAALLRCAITREVGRASCSRPTPSSTPPTPPRPSCGPAFPRSRWCRPSTASSSRTSRSRSRSRGCGRRRRLCWGWGSRSAATEMQHEREISHEAQQGRHSVK